jgi:hypothetical protein
VVHHNSLHTRCTPFTKEAEAYEWEMETYLQQYTLLKCKQHPTRGFAFYLSTMLTVFDSAGGRDKALALKAKDTTSSIASQTETLAADAQAKGKDTVDQVKSKLP